MKLISIISLSLVPLSLLAHPGNDSNYEIRNVLSRHFHNWTEVQSWINNDCSPNSISDVNGFISQSGPGSYDLYVFCRKGQGEATIYVDAAYWDGKEDFTGEFSRTSRASILGFIEGSERNNVVFAFE